MNVRSYSSTNGNKIHIVESGHTGFTIREYKNGNPTFQDRVCDPECYSKENGWQETTETVPFEILRKFFSGNLKEYKKPVRTFS